MLKRCPQCKFEKFTEDFYKASGFKKNGERKTHTYCKICERERRRIYSLEKFPAGSRVLRDKSLQSRYNISLEEYNRKFEDQNRACAICKTTETTKWNVDHCHLTNKIRAILCYLCNIGLGSFKDNADNLRIAADYIEKWKLEHNK